MRRALVFVPLVALAISIGALFGTRHYAHVATKAARQTESNASFSCNVNPDATACGDQRVAKIYDTHAVCVHYIPRPCCEIDTFKGCSKADRAWLRSMGKGP